MDTKRKGDIAEQAVTLYCLEHGWDVLQPIGDRLPYDLVVVTRSDSFVRLQVKAAWQSDNGAWLIEPRQCKTNRREYRIEYYDEDDFDFAIGVIEAKRFFVIPIADLLESRGSVTLVGSGRQRPPRLANFEDQWSAVEKYAMRVQALVG